MIYLFTGIYFVYLSCAYDLLRFKKNKKIHFFLSFLLLTLISGLRYRMAPDTVWYMSYFETQVLPLDKLELSTFANSNYQPLWILLNSLCKTLGNYYLLQFAISAIFCYSFFNFILRSTREIFTAILFFYILCYVYFSMDILRESLAISMFLFSVLAYNDKNYIRSIIFIFAAYLFHQYAIFIFFVPIMIALRVSIKWKLIALGTIVLMLALFGMSLDYFTFESFDLSIYELSPNLLLTGYIYNFFKILPCLFFMFKFRNTDIPGLLVKKNIIFDLCVIYIATVLITITSIPFMDRISNYFILFPIILISSGMYSILRSYTGRSLVLPFAIFSYFIVFLFCVFPLLKLHPIYEVETYKRYYPYYTFLTEEVDSDREYISRFEAKE